MATAKNFKWNVKEIELKHDTLYTRGPSIIAHLDIMSNPFSTASMTELAVDLQNRLSGTNPTHPTIKNVIFNPPATIVLWSDNSKTVVKVQDGDEFDPEKGLAMAIVKRMNGNTGKYCEIFKKWVPEEDYPELPSISYEEAIKKIRHGVDTAQKAILNSLYGAPKKEMDWIATDDKMPTEDGDYLVYDPFIGGSYVYEFDSDSISDTSYWKNNITHWMPVPAAPNKKGV
jgi:hypothetical protein